MNRDKVAYSVVAALVAVFVGFLMYSKAAADYVHSYRIECKSPPPTDDALRDWLKTQPGVKRVTVAREGTALLVEFTTPERSFSRVPNPFVEATRLGYKDMSGVTHQRRSKLW